jgi:hypothetical protein
MRTVPLAFSAVLLLGAPLAAQLTRPGTPVSRTTSLVSEVPVAQAPAPELARYLAEDADVVASGEMAPYRYGAVIAMNVGMEEHGVWEDVPGTGELVWRLEIQSPGAYSLGLLFAEFDLPAGAEVYLSHPTSSEVLGAYTESNEKPHGRLAIQPYPGDRVVVEYVQPAGVAETPRLQLEHVVHDYRDVYATVFPALQARANPCLIDVNCSEGDPYQDIKRSVIRIQTSGVLCSGSILNNTAEDGTPYMLTAHHCGNYTDGTFLFGYEIPDCGTGSASATNFLSGSTRLAQDDPYDSQLYVLDETPPASFKPYYAGWGRGSTPSAPAVSISHPAGLPKKIAIDEDPPIDTGTFFAVTWEDGIVLGGSSGSPLFNHNKRVIGPACCVTNFTCGIQQTNYGKFYKFYARNTLSQWLDPLGTGTVGLAGHEPNPAKAKWWNGSGVNPDVYTSNAPILGESWVATVDTSGHPGVTTTVVVGRQLPTSGSFFAYGELLIDLGSPLLFQSVQPVIGGVSTHTAPIPVDFGLIGASAFTQALMFGGGVQATNRVKLTAGCGT